MILDNLAEGRVAHHTLRALLGFCPKIVVSSENTQNFDVSLPLALQHLEESFCNRCPPQTHSGCTHGGRGEGVQSTHTHTQIHVEGTRAFSYRSRPCIIYRLTAERGMACVRGMGAGGRVGEGPCVSMSQYQNVFCFSALCLFGESCNG